MRINYKGIYIYAGLHLMFKGRVLPGWGFWIPRMKEDGFNFTSREEALTVAKQLVDKKVLK